MLGAGMCIVCRIGSVEDAIALLRNVSFADKSRPWMASSKSRRRSGMESSPIIIFCTCWPMSLLSTVPPSPPTALAAEPTALATLSAAAFGSRATSTSPRPISTDLDRITLPTVPTVSLRLAGFSAFAASLSFAFATTSETTVENFAFCSLTLLRRLFHCLFAAESLSGIVSESPSGPARCFLLGVGKRGEQVR